MESTISVSKGCFVFKNGATRSISRKKVSKSRSKRKQGATISGIHSSEKWYTTYKEVWTSFQQEIDDLQENSYRKSLDGLVQFVEASSHDYEDAILPAAVLLTGINQPDHYELFETLADDIREKNSSHSVVLHSRDCPTIKEAVEQIVGAFVNEDDSENEGPNIKRPQCTLQVLKAWFFHKYRNFSANERPTLAVIIPDFEIISVKVIQDLILSLSSYTKYLPLVLVLGIATSISSLHNTLPYQVTSKMKMHVFDSQSPTILLNNIIDEIILAPHNSFRLSGKVFQLLTDIFFFYDFSLHGFTQAFKYCLMEHYIQGNPFALCSSHKSAMRHIDNLSGLDLEQIRQLPSFRRYVESMNHPEDVIAVLTQDDELRKRLPNLIDDIFSYLFMFQFSIETLKTLLIDLPKNRLGKEMHEIYTKCSSESVIAMEEFKESWQLLGLTSRDEFVEKIYRIIDCVRKFLHKCKNNKTLSEKECKSSLELIKEHLKKMLISMDNNFPSKANNDSVVLEDDKNEQPLVGIHNRQELKARLQQMSKQPKQRSAFQNHVQSVLDYLHNEIIEKYMQPFHKGPPLLELFVFSDVTQVRRHIIGAPRATLHTALNNPQYYLQCNCCELEDTMHLLATLPDLSVAYKLHLECGKMINLFDWLQAFKTVADGSDLDNEHTITPEVQARFTLAVAELQFLGFIKTSKRKTDHVTRLTW